MPADEHARLVERTIRFKKASSVLIAIMGQGKRSIPAYPLNDHEYMATKKLRQHLAEVETAFESLARSAIQHLRRSNLDHVTRWLAEKHDLWNKTDNGLFDLGRVYEVESAIGPLAHRKIMDCPPYAQVLLQGFNGAGIRHPEYHLGTDLALLYNLFCDSEAMNDKAQQSGQMHSSEHSQSLGRNVILTCFNLIESFVSGLTASYLIENPGASAEIVAKLKDDRASLRKRMLQVPCLISGKTEIIMPGDSSFQLLFGECKERRDSFVHCEPGSVPTKWGYVKEQRFHDITEAAVTQTVDLTENIICKIWQAVYGRERPSWLPKRNEGRRYPRIAVTLRPV